jgi:hypothetical protein
MGSASKYAKYADILIKSAKAIAVTDKGWTSYNVALNTAKSDIGDRYIIISVPPGSNVIPIKGAAHRVKLMKKAYWIIDEDVSVIIGKDYFTYDDPVFTDTLDLDDGTEVELNMKAGKELAYYLIKPMVGYRNPITGVTYYEPIINQTLRLKDIPDEITFAIFAGLSDNPNEIGMRYELVGHWNKGYIADAVYEQLDNQITAIKLFKS